MVKESNRQTYWTLAILVALVQNAIAVFAIYSSSQDILSDGACIGGVFGTIGNLAVICVVVIWAIILAAKSFRAPHWHIGLVPLLVVALSSVIAIFIGMIAALHCTV